MSRYTIVAGREHGYRIEVVDSYGSRHTMLGFDTEEDARQWIRADGRRDAMQVREFSALPDAAD